MPIKLNLGFMQGRLCDQVSGKIQAFPVKDWQQEFIIAKRINMPLMEWTLDHEGLYDNPLMTKSGRKKINSLCLLYNLSIPSLTGDCFMQKPFWKKSGIEAIGLKKSFLDICLACSNIGIKMIVVPLVDNGSIENDYQEDCLVDFLLLNEKLFQSKNINIIFESDYDPLKLQYFINRLPSKCFGINYDIGNSASLGFDPTEEFYAYGNRIVNVHIKDRILGGATVPLGSGEADFQLVFSHLKKINYSGNYILQTARSLEGDHTNTILKYQDMVVGWVSACGLNSNE